MGARPPALSQLAFCQQLARALQGGQQRTPVALLTVHQGLLRLLFRTPRQLAAQAKIAVEAQVKRAGFVFEQLVDDGALARAGCLEESHLALRFEADDLAQILASDRRFPDEVRRAFFDDVALRAESWRQEGSCVAR